jgi:hypothetical protein
VEELKQLLPEPAFAKATDELGQIRDQSQEKAIYDQRQKAIRDRAYELKMAIAEGEERGEQRGIALGEERDEALGALNTLEGLLGLPVTSRNAAQSLDITTLKAKADDLRAQLRERS